MNTEQFRELIATRREGRNLEFKQSMPWSSAEWKAKLVKSVLAFSNVRDGGNIVIGIEESNTGEFVLAGMPEEHHSGYNQDDVDSEVAIFADPYAKCTVHKLIVDGTRFVVLDVEEFLEVPVICKKDGVNNLRKGAVYTRAYGKAETIIVPSQTEMREILEVATDKTTRKFLERAQRVGLLSTLPPLPSADERYDEQLEDLQ